MRRSCLVAVGLALAGCDDDPTSEPCLDGAPGIRFVISLPIEAETPGELGVGYANGEVERFDDQIPAAPWDDPLVVTVAYGDGAVDGQAEATFSARPEPPRQARGTFTADLSQCVEVELTLEILPD